MLTQQVDEALGIGARRAFWWSNAIVAACTGHERAAESNQPSST
jgi:hypothetical protein